MANLLLVALLQGAGAAYTFVTIGDWGGYTLGSYHAANEVAVAKQLGTTASDINAKFVVNTGDNFYYCGVMNITDDQFKTDFENVFTDKSLMVPWYSVLGNHDYAYDVDAQLNYKSPNNDRWQMQGRYYSKRIQLGDSQYATFIFLDTNPCVQSYLDTDPSGWDPCSGDYGDECQVDGSCNFHQHVVAQDCSKQAAWLQTTLASVDKNDWIIGVGHHPAEEIDVQDLIGQLVAGGMRLYLNGHTHAMIHYTLDGNTNVDYVTSGAGCMVDTHDQDRKLSTSRGRSINKVLDKKISGFSTHTFSSDFKTLTTNFLDADGNVFHTFETAKSGSAPPSPPSPPSPPLPPSPPSPPSPSGEGSCSSYGCGKYSRSQACQCNPACKYHKDCCDDYEETCGGVESLVI